MLNYQKQMLLKENLDTLVNLMYSSFMLDLDCVNVTFSFKVLLIFFPTFKLLFLTGINDYKIFSFSVELYIVKCRKLHITGTVVFAVLFVVVDPL